MPEPSPTGPSDPAASTAPSAPLISLRGYGFRYRAQAEPTLVDIDLEIRRGEKVAIVGASGSGKSTLLSALNGLIPHHHAGEATGTIEVFGQDPAAVPLVETSSRVGTVLQDSNAQVVGLTVGEDIAFSLENQQVPRERMPELVRRAAERVGIAHRLDDSPLELSGGQKQRVSVAGVLVDEVEVLLFDEPLANLDPASGRAAIELIDALHSEQDATVVIVEHRLEDVLHRDVDRIVLMAEGRIVIDAEPQTVLASGLLERHGIRPPLHVTALAYAGAPVTASQRPARVETMELREEQIAAIREWVAHAPIEDPAPQQGRGTALQLEGLSCVLPGAGQEPRTVLREVDARVARGEMIGILGSNGAGKSTLARVVCGFERATGGTVRIGAVDAAGWSIAERGRHVGFVLQEPSQMLSQPLIREEIALGLHALGLAEAEIAERTERVLGICGLTPMRSWPVSALSHGQRKRVTIAAVLALEPEVLILDEPTAGQDFGHYTEFMEFLREVNASGTTVLLITHDMHLALEYTDRVLVMSGGEVLADAEPAQVLTDAGITERADLVPTGLHALARRCGLADAQALVRRFVAVDRQVRAQEHAA